MNTDVGVVGRDLVKVLLQQDVLLVNVGEDKVNLSLVLRVLGDGADDLEHGGDSGSSSNHGEGADHVGGVDELSLRTTAADGLTDLQVGEVLGDVTGGVGLDEKVEVTKVGIGRNGSVRANNFLSINSGGDRDVLSDGESEDAGGGGKVELVTVMCERLSRCSRDVMRLHCHVVGNDGLVRERELLELIGLEDTGRL